VGWRYVAWAWEKELAGREKLLLLALAYHANEDDEGLAWPRIGTLCRDTGLSERTVQRALDALEAVDLVYRWETVVDGEPSSNTYLLNVYDQGPTEWRRYRMARARQVRRGWVHRRNLDRAGTGNRGTPGHTPPLFGGVADRKLQELLPSDSLTPPPRQRDTTGRQPDTRGCQVDARVASD
jgi:hypothetical protein